MAPPAPFSSRGLSGHQASQALQVARKRSRYRQDLLLRNPTDVFVGGRSQKRSIWSGTTCLCMRMSADSPATRAIFVSGRSRTWPCMWRPRSISWEFAFLSSSVCVDKVQTSYRVSAVDCLLSTQGSINDIVLFPNIFAPFCFLKTKSGIEIEKASRILLKMAIVLL